VETVLGECIMTTISRDKITYTFGPENTPVAKVKPGETVLLETHDCFTGQIQSERDLITEVDFSRVNPATGPIEVDGANAGDILVVDILDIEVGSSGFMVAIPEEGAFGNKIKQPSTRAITIFDGRFYFDSTRSFPLRPMIGVIGVSPGDYSLPCGEIGDHGGNMDVKVIAKGARIYFKVRQQGAMLALGDAHAGMGDGEAVICGVEISARVKIRCTVVDAPQYVPERPIVEYENRFIRIGHGSTIDDAASCALEDMLDLVSYKTGMFVNDAGMLISAVGDLRVCQIVDPQKTARVEMPKSVLKEPDLPIFQ
jgi:amidase